MKVLILSCNTGGGHNACAKAIKEVFDQHGDICHIEDSIRFVSVKLSRFMTWGHDTMYKHIPGLFRFGYGFAETHPGVLNDDAVLYKLLTSGTQQLYAFITEGRYNAVICTHVFSGLLLSNMMRKHPINIKTAFVSTDYTCSPGAAKSNLDLYFVPGTSQTEEFVAGGVPKGKIIVSGMPVSQAFYKSTDKAIAKTRYGIDPNHTHLLVMCGSMGCGPLKKLTELLSVRIRDNCEISIICGTNENLFDKLSQHYSDKRNIHIHGFVDNISSLMDSADLYLTKPGGLSSSEGATKNLPMVFINAVAGCEDYNLRYFVDMGGATTASTVWELVELCVDLLENEGKRNQMKWALSAQDHINAAECIYTTIHAPQTKRGICE